MYKVDHSLLLKPLSSLYNEECLSMTYPDLLFICASVFESIHVEQAKNIDIVTRAQSQSKAWFHYRAGCLTASKFKAACHTDCTCPSQSLINLFVILRVSMVIQRLYVGGCDHERTARNAYFLKKQGDHLNFSVSDRGLVINPAYLYMGGGNHSTFTSSICRQEH